MPPTNGANAMSEFIKGQPYKGQVDEAHPAVLTTSWPEPAFPSRPHGSGSRDGISSKRSYASIS